MKASLDTRFLGTLGVLLLGAAIWVLWPDRPGALVAAEARRDLGEYLVRQMPEDLPQSWRDELARELDQAPQLDLLHPRCDQQITQRLTRVSWIDPESIEVRIDHPRGAHVHFRNRIPRFRLVRAGRRLGITSQSGTVLPAGVPEDLAAQLIQVEVLEGSVFPEAGRVCADPVVQEAGRALVEFSTLYHELKLDLVGIRLRSGYPLEQRNLPTPLAFVFRDGGVINYGYAAGTRAPNDPPASLKKLRLVKLMQAFPALRGLSEIDLDGPRLHVRDENGEEVPVAIDGT